MEIIGITGNSGSGKTELSKILGMREDVRIIDADKVVREISIPGTEYFHSIKETFGEKILSGDGNLNRQELASKIYNDKKSREDLNRLTFKYVVAEIIDRLKNTDDKNVKYIVIDAPLLFESKLYKCCDFIISLIADEELKIKRICKRDNIDRETAKKRLSIQNIDSYYTEKSDFVIENSENCDLKLEVEKIFEKILRK